MSVVDYLIDIVKIAKCLAQGDSLFAEELIQEMSIALLEEDPGVDKGLCLYHAKLRAYHFIHSKKHHYSHGNVFPHFSLEALLTTGAQIDTNGQFYPPPLLK